MTKVQKWGWPALPLALAAGMMPVGCGTPGAPQPPSLNLPNRVLDLAAARAGNRVSLTWTMPKKNTDKLLLKGSIDVRICRSEAAGPCQAPASDMAWTPGAAGSFAETLPAALAAGSPRPLTYYVELKNRNGRSAGLSNAATVLAGAAPRPIANLTAEVRKSGVVLRWTPDAAQEPVRLHRKLLTPPAAKPEKGPLAAPPEPLEQNLLVEPGAQARALDRTIRFGQTYEYRVQRVARVVSGNSTLELAGELSSPVRVETLDIFPPAIPAGLAAVASLEGDAATVDLSWQPDTEADLAGYAVYRREGSSGWERISPPQPLIGPGFRDAKVQPGHTYRYAVTAIDQGGHESKRSEEAQETVPEP